MVINRKRMISVGVATALLLAIVFTLLAGNGTQAVGQVSGQARLNFEEIEWTVVAGERGAARVACDAGYIVDAAAWEVTGEDTAPPALKVVSKVSKNQRGIRFVGFYPARFFDVFTEISLKGTVTCLLPYLEQSN
jgi:hypothetical protein